MERSLLETADQLVEQVDLQNYGIGVPFAFGSIGLAILVSTAKGIAMFGSLTKYGKVGVITLVIIGTFGLVLAGYLYNEMDRGWWVLTNEDAKTVGDDQ